MPITATSDAEILARAIDPHAPDLPLEAAQLFKQVDFAPEDHEQMKALTEKSRNGTLTDEERTALRTYERVNDLLGILRSKARCSLKNARQD